MRIRSAGILVVASLVLLMGQDGQQPQQKKIQRARRDVPCTVPAQVVGEKLADVKQVPKTDQPAQTAIEKHTIEKEKVIEIRYVKSADHDLNAHAVQALQFNSVPVAPGKSEIVTFGQTDLHSGGNIQVESGTPYPLDLAEGQQLLAAGQQVKMGNYNSPQPAIMFRVVKTESPLTVHYLNPYELAVTANGLNTGANPFFYWKNGNDFVEAKPEYLIRSQDAFTAILPYKPDGTSPDLYIVGKHAYSATVPLPKFESGKNEVKWNAGEKTQALIFDAKTNSYKVSDGNSESVDPLTAVQLQSNSKVDLPVREVVFASITPTGTMFPNPMPFTLNYTEPSAPSASWVAGTLPALGMLGGGFLLYRAIDALTGKDSDPGTGTGTSQPPETSALAANPSTLAFNYTTGGTVPAPQSVAISSLKVASLDFTAASTAAWLTLNGAQGRTPSSVTATVNPAGLAAGIYTAAINIVCPSNLEVTPATVSVTLLVNSAPDTGGGSPVSLLPPFINLTTPTSSGGFGPGGGDGIIDKVEPEIGDVGTYGSLKLDEAKPIELTQPDLCTSGCTCENSAAGRCPCDQTDCPNHKGGKSGEWHLTINGTNETLHQVGNTVLTDNRATIKDAIFHNGRRDYSEDGWSFTITNVNISYEGKPDIKAVKKTIGKIEIAAGYSKTQAIGIHVNGNWTYDPPGCDGKKHCAKPSPKISVTVPRYTLKYKAEVKRRKTTTGAILGEEVLTVTCHSVAVDPEQKAVDGAISASAGAKTCAPEFWGRPGNPGIPNPNITPPIGGSDNTNKGIPTLASVAGSNPVVYVKVSGQKYTPPPTGAKIVNPDGTLRNADSTVTLSDVAGVLVPVAGAATTYYFISARDRNDNTVPGGVPVIPAANLPRGGTLSGTHVAQPIATVADPGKRIVATSSSPTLKYSDGTPLKVDREFSDVGSVDGKSVYVSQPGDALKDGTKSEVIEQNSDGTESKIGTVDGYVWVTEMNTMTSEKQAVEGQPIQAAFKISGTPPVEQQTVQVILGPMLQLTGSLGLQNPTVTRNAVGQTVVTGNVPAGTTIVTVNANALGDGGVQLVPVYVP